jgi:hypothetical protein
MSALWQKLADLIAAGDVRVAEHGYEALADDGLGIDEILSGVPRAVVVEEYPDYPKGPAALVLQLDTEGKPLHAVWGIPLVQHCFCKSPVRTVALS